MQLRLEPLPGHVQCLLLVRWGFMELGTHETSVPFPVPGITSRERKDGCSKMRPSSTLDALLLV